MLAIILGILSLFKTKSPKNVIKSITKGKIMSLITEHLDPDISESRSRFKQFFGIPVIGTNGSLLDGEETFPDGTIVRFQNGLIDGNIYDSRGEVLYTYPAVEYADSPGKEYWTKGLPQGYPAICQDAGLYEEYWSDGKIDKTVETIHNFEICFDDDDEEYIEDDNQHPSFFHAFDYLDEENEDDDTQNNNSPQDFCENNNFSTIDSVLSYEHPLSFQERLFHIMKIKGIQKDTDVYKPIYMSEKAFNRIKNGKPTDSISLDNAIMISFSLKLTFEQMIKFTNFAGKGFRNFGERDKIIKEFFDNKNFKIFELNRKLSSNGLKPFFESKDDKFFL